MDQNLDGNDPQTTEWTQQVTGWLRIKPVDDVSFTEHDECLQVRDRGVSERDRQSQLHCATTEDRLVHTLTPVTLTAHMVVKWDNNPYVTSTILKVSLSMFTCIQVIRFQSAFTTKLISQVLCKRETQFL